LRTSAIFSLILYWNVRDMKISDKKSNVRLTRQMRFHLVYTKLSTFFY
jgi:hypothetical protein